jgi:hypothetical protein
MTEFLDLSDYPKDPRGNVGAPVEPTTTTRCVFCRECGGFIDYDRTVRLPSSPAKYKGKCSDCGSTRYVHCRTLEAMNERITFANDPKTEASNEMQEQTIEQEIQDKNLNAPRLTPDLINSKIEGKAFHVFGETCLTVCCLTLENGFTVTGESACASPENFDAEIGEKIAFEQARNKIWMLEGYLLKQKLHDGKSA